MVILIHQDYVLTRYVYNGGFFSVIKHSIVLTATFNCIANEAIFSVTFLMAFSVFSYRHWLLFML